MDIKTFILIFSLANFFIFLFLVFYDLTSHRKNEIIRIFTLAKFIMGLGWLLMAARNNIPHIFSVTIGNILVFYSIVAEVYCIVKFDALINRKNLKFFIIPFFAIAIIYVLFSNHSENIRVLIASFIAGTIYSTGAIVLIFKQLKSKLSYLVIFLYFYLGTIYYFRGIGAILFDSHMTLTSQGFIQSISFISFLMITYLGTIILLLLLKENDDRKIDLQTQALNDSNQMLKNSNATKDQLFSIIAHDLRNTFSVVLQFTELLQNRKTTLSDENKNKLIEILYNSSSETYELLENLLNWARGQMNAHAANPKALKIKQLITVVMEQIQRQAQAKNQLIENTIPEDWETFADYEMIKVAVRNILSNAIKFSPKGGKITIKGLDEEKNIQIKFIDQGIGITPEILEKLLSPDYHYTTVGTANEKVLVWD